MGSTAFLFAVNLFGVDGWRVRDTPGCKHDISRLYVGLIVALHFGFAVPAATGIALGSPV